MRFFYAITSLGLMFLPLLTPAADAAGASIYWGAKIPGAPFDMSAVRRFESHTGKNMSIIEWGQAWTSGGHFQSFQTSAFQDAREHGLLPLLTWGSWDTRGEKASAPNYQLADIIGGKYDAGIAAWAREAKAWGHPFFLRFDHEMNGWWYPWSEQVNGNRSGQYVKMWRHVHDIFTRVGANNVTWVWCPNIVGRRSTPTAELYPGDNYVDWTCFDGYNWGNVKGGWQTFGQIMTGSAAFTGGHNTYQELLRVAPSKPILIGETASVEQGGSKAAWITDMLRDLPTKYPRVKAFVWTNVVEDSAGWPIESSSSAESAFRRGIASSAYASNHYASISGKIRAAQ
jgi:mannan endo-1,4-beta-mannosidase